VLGSILGLFGLSVVAGVLVAAMVTPAIALTGITANSTISIFDGLPSSIQPGTLSERNTIFAVDAAGNPVQVAYIYDQNRVEVPLEEISPFVIDAALAGEDPRFYEHGGVDIAAVMRATYGEITGNDLGGASTITMQYVRNILKQQAEAIGDEEAIKAAEVQTADRKLQEMKYAISLEKEFSKDEIMLGYLNIAFFGGTTYGIEAAAQRYYSVHAKDLTLAQAASLLAIVQYPNQNLLDDAADEINGEANGYAKNKARRDYILGNMLDEKRITQAQYDEAIVLPVEPAVSIPTSGCISATVAPYFCDYVTKVMQQDPAFGATLEERQALIKQGGFQIYTTLDLDLQAATEAAVLGNVPATMAGIQIGSSAVTVQPGTGRILSMTQNTVYDPTQDAGLIPGHSSVNYSTDFAYGGSIGFQTGSTYKIFTLAEWLKAGHSLGETVVGNNRSFPQSRFHSSCGGVGGANWSVKNASATPARVSAYQALVQSINTAFAEMSTKLDLCELKNTAVSLGVHTGKGEEPETNPAATLGTNNISPLTMAAAVAGIANDGVFCTPIAIDRIVDRTGNEIVPPQANCNQAIAPEIAAGVANAMQGVIASGTATASNPRNGIPHIAKTGTTDSSVQTWVVGGSKAVSMAVWVGNVVGDVSTNKLRVNGTGVNLLRHKIFKAVMTAADGKYPGGEFLAPTAEIVAGKSVLLPAEIIGQSPAQVEALLATLGFTTAVGGAIDSALPAGTVAATDPAAGSKIPSGSTITYFTSNGSQKALPDVTTAKNFGEARALLQAGGFTGSINQQDVDSDLPKGTVVGTDPGAGSVIGLSSPIKVLISKGPDD
jgi:membrane peptidoglycan carboxypeptidase